MAAGELGRALDAVFGKVRRKRELVLMDLWGTGRSAREECGPSDDKRFRFIGLLGQGGMGEVLLAQQRPFDREVAIKVIRGDADPDSLDAFRGEMRVAAMLDHPAVVLVHDAGDDFYVMKRVRGRTLGDALREEITAMVGEEL